jgi:transcriptional regulator with XRE-family HTH domain
MFWLKFSYLCAGQGKSANAVAKELGIPSGSITAWSKGAVPRNATLLKIAEYFSVSVDYLLSNNEKKPTPQTESELSRKFATLTAEEAQDAMRYINFLISQRGE